MINNNNKVCGWNMDLEGEFNGLTKVASPASVGGNNFAKSKYSASAVDKVTLMPPVLRAIALYVGKTYDSTKTMPEVALGKTTKGLWICEKSVPERPGHTMIATYDPVTGAVRAGEYDSISKDVEKIRIGHPKEKYEDAQVDCGELIWFLLMGVFLDDEEAQQTLNELQEKLKTGSWSDCQKEAGVLCDNIYYRACKQFAPDSALIHVDDVAQKGACPKIAETKIARGFVVNEVIIGEFNIISKASGSQMVASLDPEKTDLGWEVPEEGREFLISSMDGYVPTRQVANVLNILKKGREHSELEIKNFFFIGPPGSGKSEDARAVAYYGGRPFTVMCLSSGVTEDNFKGFLAPKIGESSAFSEEEKAVLSYAADVFPSDMDIDVHTEKTYEKLVGKEKKGVEPLEVYAEAYNKLLSYTKALEKKGGDDKGIEYVYIPSPLILALKYGFVCEVQEPSSVADPTVMTCLNEVMNKLDGVIDTPNGPVKRHRNCVVIMTDNYSTDIGNSNMNQAVKDRAGTITMWYERGSKQKMIDMARKNGITVNQNICEAVADIVEVVDTEANKMENSIKGVAGYRSFISCLRCIQMGFDVTEAVEMTVINKICTNPEEKEILTDIVTASTNFDEF